MEQTVVSLAVVRTSGSLVSRAMSWMVFMCCASLALLVDAAETPRARRRSRDGAAERVPKRSGGSQRPLTTSAGDAVGRGAKYPAATAARAPPYEPHRTAGGRRR